KVTLLQSTLALTLNPSPPRRGRQLPDVCSHFDGRSAGSARFSCSGVQSTNSLGEFSPRPSPPGEGRAVGGLSVVGRVSSTACATRKLGWLAGWKRCDTAGWKPALRVGKGPFLDRLENMPSAPPPPSKALRRAGWPSPPSAFVKSTSADREEEREA